MRGLPGEAMCTGRPPGFITPMRSPFPCRPEPAGEKEDARVETAHGKEAHVKPLSETWLTRNPISSCGRAA